MKSLECEYAHNPPKKGLESVILTSKNKLDLSNDWDQVKMTWLQRIPQFGGENALLCLVHLNTVLRPEYEESTKRGTVDKCPNRFCHSILQRILAPCPHRRVVRAIGDAPQSNPDRFLGEGR